MTLRIPDRLRELLVDSPFEGATLRFRDAADELLSDNELPFFPAYTDHGREHVERTLHAAEALVPEEAWEPRRRLLQPADAAVLVCATILHDLGLHLRARGFMELVAEDSPYRPLHWFNRPQGARPADVAWHRCWEDFRTRARHLTKSQIDRLLGPENDGVPSIAYGDETPPPQDWTAHDHLLVGDFVRRHHARLAHEIALYGFPGIPHDVFPPLRVGLPAMADAIGLVARSHNEPLRVCVSYLQDYLQRDNLRPAGALLPYAMALLRVADYFQLEADRAPLLLLHLKAPQSPKSVEEWHKHHAVGSIGPSSNDPAAVHVEVLPSHGLRTHLQLGELLDGLQQELDVAAAVLSELYRDGELSVLRLRYQRVKTNLAAPSLHEQLPYVPRRAGLRSADDLFRLVVRDLYGDQLAVAGRELLQNAVDAVRARRRWEALADTRIDRRLFRRQARDVVVELVERDEQLALRVSDRGIGMTPETVVEHFLTAGSSLRPSASDLTAPDAATSIRWLKAGKFGIGAFAAFLLGSEAHVRTRHVAAERGISFVASVDDELVQLDWAELPFGTEVVVPFSRERLLATQPRVALYRPADGLLHEICDSYALTDPAVAFKLTGPRGRCLTLRPRSSVPRTDRPLPTTWRSLEVPGYDAILWTYRGRFSHNGIVLREDARNARFRSLTAYTWARHEALFTLMPPGLAVFDSQHRLQVALTRDRLASEHLPFEDELLDAIGTDVLASGLAHGARDHPLGMLGWLEPVFTRTRWLPLYPGLLDRWLADELCVLWSEPEGLERFQRFRRQRNPAGGRWEAWPCRAVLEAPPLEDSLSFDVDDPSGIHSFVRDVEDRARLLGWEQVASVVVLPDGPEHERLAYLGPEWRSTPLDIGGSPFAALTCVDEVDDEPLRDKLVASVRELVADGHDGLVGLSVLRRPEGAATQPDPIVHAWERGLDAAIARSTAARSEQAAAMATTSVAARDYLERWQRTPAKPLSRLRPASRRRRRTTR
jgi:hypothetical protein